MIQSGQNAIIMWERLVKALARFTVKHQPSVEDIPN